MVAPPPQKSWYVLKNEENLKDRVPCSARFSTKDSSGGALVTLPKSPSCRKAERRGVCVSTTPCNPLDCSPLSMTFSKEEYQSRLLFPTPRSLPNPGIKPTSLTFAMLADGFFTTAPHGKSKGEFAGYLIKDVGGCWWCRPALSVLSIVRKEPWFSPVLRKGRGKLSRRGCMCLTLCSISGHKLRGSEGTVYKHLL